MVVALSRLGARLRCTACSDSRGGLHPDVTNRLGEWAGCGVRSGPPLPATVFYQPNFAFNLMAQRIKDKEMEGIDLSSVRLMCNGAEPCFRDSHATFLNGFRDGVSGLSPWGLCTAWRRSRIPSSLGHREPIRTDVIDRFALQAELRAVPVAEGHQAAQYMLGVGRALEGTEFKIVDNNRGELPERWVGEVAIRSRASFSGYHLNPSATAAVLDSDGWYFSGDMGYRVGDVLHHRTQERHDHRRRRQYLSPRYRGYRRGTPHGSGRATCHR